MIARCYLRVSTEDQAKEGYSLGAQRDRLVAFAASQGWQVAEFYVDDGASAKDMKRPAFRRLLLEIVRGEVVLVYRLDRLTRNVGDLDYLLRRWEDDGVLFRSCTEDFNTTTAAGRLFIRLVADLAHWERENLAERTRMGMVKRAQEGEWNGGRPPFGYNSVEVGRRPGGKVQRELRPDTNALIVRELYERYVAGQGMRQLTLWLNRQKGIKSARGGLWSDSSVSGILKNPIYCGLLAWDWGVKNGPRNPAALVVQGKHDAILSRDLWEQAQRVREQRRSLPPRASTGANILTGVGRCGLCGGCLKVNRSGELRYYRCGRYAGAGACSLSGVCATQVEANFVERVCALADRLVSPGMARSIAARFLAEERARRPGAPELGRQLALTRQAIAVWDSALEKRQIEVSTWQQKIASHQIRLLDLEKQVADAVEAEGHSLEFETLVAEGLQGFRSIWAVATPTERKSLALAFFREVRVFPDGSVQVVQRVPGVEPSYLIPVGIDEQELPPEVGAGLRICVLVAARSASSSHNRGTV